MQNIFLFLVHFNYSSVTLHWSFVLLDSHVSSLFFFFPPYCTNFSKSVFITHLMSTTLCSMILTIYLYSEELSSGLLLALPVLKTDFCFAVLNHSVMSYCLRPHGLQPASLLGPWGLSRQDYWNGLPYPPPGESSQPRDQTQVSCIEGGFFTS